MQNPRKELEGQATPNLCVISVISLCVSMKKMDGGNQMAELLVSLSIFFVHCPAGFSQVFAMRRKASGPSWSFVRAAGYRWLLHFFGSVKEGKENINTFCQWLLVVTWSS